MMRKLDNYGTFFVIAIGLAVAIGISILAISLDALSAFRATILTFGVVMGGGVVVVFSAQTEIRAKERDEATRAEQLKIQEEQAKIIKDKLTLLEQAKALGIRPDLTRMTPLSPTGQTITPQTVDAALGYEVEKAKVSVESPPKSTSGLMVEFNCDGFNPDNNRCKYTWENFDDETDHDRDLDHQGRAYAVLKERMQRDMRRRA